jgi:oligosaccharide repeat unit polymerase
MTACIVNPLCLFLGVWGAATVLYLGGVLAGTFPSPKLLTVEALLLNIGTFCLGYLTWSLFQSLSAQSAGGLVPTKPLTRNHLVRALRFTLLVGLAALLMELYRIAALAWYFNTSWSYLATHPAVFRLRLVTFIASNVFQTSYTVMLLSLTNSIFSIGFILLGLFLYLDRTRWKYVYLSAFLLISFVIGLMHLSRYEVTANILYLVLAYCFMHAQDSVKFQVLSLKSSHFPLPTSHFKLLVPIAVIALLFLAIDILLRKSGEYAQANRLQGFVFHLYWYLASPLAAFNEFLTTFNGHYELGQNTFFPIYKWLCRFHLAQQAEMSVYGDKVLIPYVANVYTYLRNFYADFGILGVALAPYLLGWAAAAVRQQAIRYFHFLNLYLVLLMFILFSSYNYFLFSNQNYLQILFGFLFFRYEFDSSHESHT